MAPPPPPRWATCMTADILLNILLRLRPLDIHRLKLVNKQWLDAISDPGFEESYLARRHDFSLIFSTAGRDPIVLQKRSTTLVPRRLQRNAAYLGSCKGLALFTAQAEVGPRGELGTVLSLANPFTGEVIRLPPFHGHSVSLHIATIGCNPFDGKLKVVAVGESHWENPLVGGVLTLGSNSWKEFGRFYSDFPEIDAPAIAVGGDLHWRDDTAIRSIDLANEGFRQTDVTFCSAAEFKSSIMLEWDGCLAVVPRYCRQPSYTVWVLRESRWEELECLKIDIAFFERLCPSECFFDYQYPPYPVASLKDGKVIIFRKVSSEEDHFFVYDMRGQVMTFFATESLEGGSINPEGEEYLGSGLDTGTFTAHAYSMVSCRGNSKI